MHCTGYNSTQYPKRIENEKWTQFLKFCLQYTAVNIKNGIFLGGGGGGGMGGWCKLVGLHHSWAQQKLSPLSPLSPLNILLTINGRILTGMDVREWV